jgi:hypothetical protein
MAQTADEIRQYIEARRGLLAQDINELEYRVKTTMDWRQQFREHTGAFLGAAFGLGLLFGLATAPSRRDGAESYRSS